MVKKQVEENKKLTYDAVVSVCVCVMLHKMNLQLHKKRSSIPELFLANVSQKLIQKLLQYFLDKLYMEIQVLSYYASFEKMIFFSTKKVTPINGVYVDVRDVALAHVNALTLDLKSKSFSVNYRPGFL